VRAVHLAAGVLLLLAAGCASDGGEAVDIAVIELLGPSGSDPGEVPHFEWSPIDDAAEYGVVVQDAGGAALWAWRGGETDVWFGGLSRERPAGMAGPVVGEGATWRAIAFDEEGHVVAVSAEGTLGSG